MSLLVVFIISFFTVTSITAQANKAIQLLDVDSNKPVTDAHFQYHKTTGISNENGLIHLPSKEPHFPLLIQHQVYGKITFSAQQMAEYFKSGQIKLTAFEYAFAPISVIAVRPKTIPGQLQELDHSDLLAHDATAVLMQNAALAGIRKSGGYGFDAVLRGFKYDRLNVVQDGLQSAMAACPNRMDPPTSQMTVNAIESIDIIKGPYALRYGVGIGGTLNFNTQSLTNWLDNKSFGRLNGSYESNGAIRRTEGLIGYGNDKSSLAVLGSFSEGNNFNSADGSAVPANFFRTSIGIKGNLELNEAHTLQLNTNYNYAKNTDFAALPMDLRSDNTLMSRLSHQFKSGGFQLSTSFYLSQVDHVMDNFSKELAPRMADAITEAATKTYGFRSEMQTTSNKGKNYLGVDLKIEEAEGIRTRTILMGPMAGRVFEDQAWQQSIIIKPSLFAEKHLFLANEITAIFSGRAEWLNADASQIDALFSAVNAAEDDNQFGLSFSAGLNKMINSNWSVSLWAARSQRLASLTERYINYFPIGLDPFELVGNSALEPETNYQSDLTLSYQSSVVQFEINGFVSQIHDFIQAYIVEGLSPRMANSPGVRQYQNISSVFRYGTEFSANISSSNNINHRVDIAYTWAKDQSLNEALPEIAPMDIRYQLNVNQANEKLQHKLIFRHVLAQKRVSASFGEIPSNAFTTIDLHSQIRLNSKVQVGIALQNLLNENYTEHLNRISRLSGTPIFAPGRSLIMNASYRF